MSTENFLEIDGVQVDISEFIKFLKFNGEYDQLIKNFARHKIALVEGEKIGIRVEDDLLQETADDFRRYLGIYRAKDTFDWLDSNGLSVDDFEQYISGQLIKKELASRVTGPEQVQEYFSLNTPMFESVDIKHLLVDSKGKADEIMATLDDDPEMFDELAGELSVGQVEKGAELLKGIRRNTLPPEMETKVFHAVPGRPVGPFPVDGEELFQIVMVVKKNAAELSEKVQQEIEELLHNEWISKKVEEHSINVY
jgi:hypothetical protein